jgi:NAD(P)-dependent dehydrogenase (short-subunit alcohol dehydrogenase family)
MSLAVVTGANRGIGLEFCRQLVARGDSVVATCRRASPELQALPVRVVADIDVTSEGACARLARDLAAEQIELLVLNAGVFESTSLDSLDFDRMRHEYDVDALGPLRVTHALLPQLQRGAKVVFVSSRAGSIADNSSGGIYGYRMAKAALNMAGASLARDLMPREIAVVMLHPGIVDTEMLRSGMSALTNRVTPADMITASVAVREMLMRIDELTLSTSGRFLHRNGQVLPW